VAKGGADETAALSKFRQRYRKSEVIFEEGSTGSEMYLIHSGRVLLSVQQNETQQTPLVVLNPGDFWVRWLWWMTPHGQLLPRLLRTTQN
jgi:hypothetical protein